MQLSMVVSLHHQSEKRLGRILTKHQLSCMWSRVCGFDVNDGKAIKPDHLLYELELRYCIRCNRQHYFLGEKIENDQAESFLLGWMQRTGYE